MILNKGKFLIIIAFILLISIFFIFNFRSWNLFSFLENNENKTENDEENNNEDSASNQEFADATLNLYNNDKTVKLELKADEIKQFDNKLLNLNPVEITAFNIDEESNESSSQSLYKLEGKSGEYMNDEDLLTISGSVKIRKGDNLFSFEKINIKEKSNEIHGKGNVSLETEEFMVSSKEFKTDFSLSTLEFYGDKQNRAKLKWKEIEDEK